MIAVGGDAVEVIHQRVAELFHLGQSWPAQGFSQPKRNCATPSRVL
jgi:hypothetical protein